MNMHLKPRWKTKVLIIKPKVYLLDIKTKRLVNKMFDKIQYLGYFKYIFSHIPFNFPMFLVYKTNVKREKKRYMVIDIRKLKDLIILDFYPLPL